MARKLDKAAMVAKPTPAKPAPDEGAGDTAVLHPDLTVPIAGRQITVREYRFVAGLRVRAKAQPLMQDLFGQIAIGEVLTEDILDVLARHDDLVRELVLEAAEGSDADWYDGLDEADGNLLLLTWWGVCGPFFVRQIARRIGQVLDMKKASAGLTCSTPSPMPATAPPTSSGTATPAAS